MNDSGSRVSVKSKSVRVSRQVAKAATLREFKNTARQDYALEEVALILFYF